MSPLRPGHSCASIMEGKIVAAGLGMRPTIANIPLCKASHFRNMAGYRRQKRLESGDEDVIS